MCRANVRDCCVIGNCGAANRTCYSISHNWLPTSFCFFKTVLILAQLLISTKTSQDQLHYKKNNVPSSLHGLCTWKWIFFYAWKSSTDLSRQEGLVIIRLMVLNFALSYEEKNSSVRFWNRVRWKDKWLRPEENVTRCIVPLYYQILWISPDSPSWPATRCVCWYAQ